MKKESKIKWIITVLLLSFCLSILMSLGSNVIIPKINIYVGLVIIILFIAISILFDMIGVAITAAEERPFHSMASKKVKGASHSVKFLKNSDKLASICNDVIGDVCGVVSGSAGVLVSNTLANMLKIDLSIVVLIVTAIIASLTITGKALGKSVAIKNSEKITFQVGKVVSIFIK